MDRTFTRRTTLSASLTRAESGVVNNDANTLKGVSAAIAGLYAALHGLRCSVATDVCRETDLRRVRVDAVGGGPAYVADNAASRIEAAMLLVDDLSAAIKAGRPFGALMVER